MPTFNSLFEMQGVVITRETELWLQAFNSLFEMRETFGDWLDRVFAGTFQFSI